MVLSALVVPVVPVTAVFVGVAVYTTTGLTSN